MRKSVKLSIIIPVFNEEENILALVRQLSKALRGKKSYEVLFIDDGSTDHTVKKIEKVISKKKQYTLIALRRNFGQTAALSAGFDHCSGEYVVTLDGDLQNDPTDIPKLLDELDKGYDLVCGWRKNRKDNQPRMMFSKVANHLIVWLSGVTIHDFGCTLKAYRGDLVRELRLYGEMHRFIPAVAAQIGAKITELPVKHHSRKKGVSKYGLDRTFRVILDVILVKFLLSFQNRPMHMFGGLGLIFSSIGGVTFLYLVIQRLLLNLALADRPLFLVSIFFILIGFQFITIGILAEMLMRVYYESQGKKTYFVREVERT